MQHRSSMKYGIVLGAGLCFALVVGRRALGGDGSVGRRYDGSAVYRDADPVAEWNVDEDKNVRWHIEFPDWGNSTPVIVGKKVFVTTEPQWLYCVDLESGEVLWKRDSNLFDLFPPETGPKLKEAWRINWRARVACPQLKRKMGELKKKLADRPDDADLQKELAAAKAEFEKEDAELKRTWHVLNDGFKGFKGAMWSPNLGYASPSPVSDGQCVYVKHGTGVVACYDLDGNRKWMKRTEYDRQASNSSSPVPAGNKLIVLRKKVSKGVIGGTYSVCAFDTATGDVVWETRPMGVPNHGAGTPALMRLGKREVVITACGKALAAEDGRVLAKGLWKNAFGATGPVVSDDVVFQDVGGRIMAVKLTADAQGGVSFKTVWDKSVRAENSIPGCGSQICTHAAHKPIPENKIVRTPILAAPVCHKGRLYAAEEGGFLWVLDTKDGKTVYADSPFPKEKREPRIYVWSALTVAGDYLFMFDRSDRGRRALVLKHAPKIELAACNPTPAVAGGPAFAGKRMVIHTRWGLCCVGAE